MQTNEAAASNTRKPNPEGIATLTALQPISGFTSSQYSEIEQKLLNLPLCKTVFE